MMDLAEIKEAHRIGGIAKCEYDSRRIDWLISEVERLKMEVHSRTIGERDANAVISRQAGMLGELRARCETAEKDRDKQKRSADDLLAISRDLTAELDTAHRERGAAYQKGQEDMRERAAKECAGYYKDYRSDYGMMLAEAIRALPIKEAALSAKEGNNGQ
jgi:hypothetical protein